MSERERLDEIAARRQRCSEILDTGGIEQALIGSDIDYLLAALAAAQVDVARLTGDLADARAAIREAARMLRGTYRDQAISGWLARPAVVATQPKEGKE